ncbi:MAG: T9SS C-terminal target domain-containing protein [Bacteroidota bacterium]
MMQLLRNLSVLLCLCIWLSPNAQAQFAPGAGLPGTTAIPTDSSIFVGWATGVSIERGPQRIDDPSLGLADFGLPEAALGMANNEVVSLGDSGVATLSFEHPIRDGEGWDFAIFENGFNTPTGYFLELGLVEVSSDGIHFFRYPATSLTDTTTQVSSFGTLDPTRLDGLAGKYETGFGVPFDLAAIPDQANFDREQVTHIRIIDVIGTINPTFSSRDTEGYPINDPWPTPFPSGGFDLDAVGVIHQNVETSTNLPPTSSPLFRLSPNPVQQGRVVQVQLYPSITRGIILDTRGQVVWEAQAGQLDTELQIPATWPKGMYFFVAEAIGGQAQVRLFVVL